MKIPEIKKENIDTLYENRFINLYGMKYENGPYYLISTRRKADDLVALKSREEYDAMMPDAVTIVLVLRIAGGEPVLYMEHEFRYTEGGFLCGPPAGLIDPGDGGSEDPRIAAARREIKEETGITVKDSDEIYVVSPLFFSSPGMTDESNAIVCAVVDLDDLSSITADGAEGTECFDGYELVTKEEAKRLIKVCRDSKGNYFSIYTWAALLYFAAEF